MMAGEPPKWPPEENGSTAAKTGPALGRRLLLVSQSVREPAETPALHMGQGAEKTGASKYQSTDRLHYWQADPPASLRNLKIKSI